MFRAELVRIADFDWRAVRQEAAFAASGATKEVSSAAPEAGSRAGKKAAPLALDTQRRAARRAAGYFDSRTRNTVSTTHIARRAQPIRYLRSVLGLSCVGRGAAEG